MIDKNVLRYVLMFVCIFIAAIGVSYVAYVFFKAKSMNFEPIKFPDQENNIHR